MDYSSFLDDGARGVWPIAVLNIKGQIRAEIDAVKGAFFGVRVECAARDTFCADSGSNTKVRADFVQVTHSRLVRGRPDEVGQLTSFIPAENLGDFPTT